MIAVPPGVRVLVATKPVDFRRGADSLAALAREELQRDPFSGVLIVFRSKRADRLKISAWDGTGLVLFWKRLEQNAFRWPPISDWGDASVGVSARRARRRAGLVAPPSARRPAPGSCVVKLRPIELAVCWSRRRANLFSSRA